MELGLSKKKVLIVGASKGIGRSIALQFAKEGAQIFCIARSEEMLIELVNEANQINELINHYKVADLMKDNPNLIASELLDKTWCF
jgi:3-oxoacyl-[acyl-carrier protein] reductase